MNSHAKKSYYAISFDEDAAGPPVTFKGYLAGFLRAIEREEEMARRIETDQLTESDLFWLNDYCRHCYAFDSHSFRFIKH
jgi:hypothetical protein